MNYEKYKKLFITEAERQGKDAAYIEKCLSYAKKLSDKNLPIIYDDEHFSLLVGLKLEFLLSIANSQHNFYRYFSIPKGNGKYRKIAEPLPMLKEVQRFILKNILLKIPCSIYAKAYKPGSTLKGNARFHRNQPILVKMDIENYFPSLHESKVYHLFFETFGYSKSLSVLLTKLCTLNSGLPQGAPTSPYLSNLLTQNMDNEIFEFCSSIGKLRYTRYADDITISGDLDPTYVISKVAKIVKANNLKINKEKTAVIRNNNRQIVTGIVVNSKLQTPKDYRKSIRLEMYYCQKYGIDSHIERHRKNNSEIEKIKYCQSMLGKINYCLQINPDDINMKKYREFMHSELQKLLH